MESGEERHQRATKAMNASPEINIQIQPLINLEIPSAGRSPIEVSGTGCDSHPRRVFIVAQRIEAVIGV